MPEPFAPKRRLGMQVAIQPYFIGTLDQRSIGQQSSASFSAGASAVHLVLARSPNLVVGVST